MAGRWAGAVAAMRGLGPLLAKAGVGGALVVTAVTVALYCLQEKLIYVPRLPGLPSHYEFLPDKFGLAYEDVHFTAADGTRLHAWFIWPKGWAPGAGRRRPSVLFLQENAGNMAYRLPFLKLLIKYLDCSVLALSYRGYGASAGSPSEAGLKQDAQAALEQLRGRGDVDPQKVVVMGKSLGGAVALHVAAANPRDIAATVVENTFLSIEDVAFKILPFLRPFFGRGRGRVSLNWLIRNKWRNYDAVRLAAAQPLLLLSSTQDEMLPPAHMHELRAIADAAGKRPCTFVELQADHMTAYETASHVYWPALMGFLSEHGLGPSEQGAL